MRLLSIETVKLGLHNLRLHKLRSLLTSLGIIFGVAAVICMLSISEGASADEMRMIQLLGTQNIIINSVKPSDSQQTSGGMKWILEYGIKDNDVSIIRETIPHVKHVVPLKTVSYRARRNEMQMNLSVTGVAPEFFEVVNIRTARGRAITPVDMEGRAKVGVIGEHVRKELFPMDDPLNQTILVERAGTVVPITIVGVLAELKTAGAPARGVEERDLNREVLIPFTTGKQEFGDIARRVASGSREASKVEYSGLYVTVDEIENVLPVSEMIRRVFAHTHKDDDYEVKVPLASLQLAEKKKKNNQLVLGFIAGISLLVGGIGIMNIMLATVTERTREIGIRRALGARQKHIAVQFLIETVVLSTGGGIIGVFLGLMGSALISNWAGWQTIVSVWSVVVSFSLSVLVGIFFGMYPAMSASRLDPIEALRRE